MSWSAPSTSTTRGAARLERLGHLEADVAATDHDHVAALGATGDLEQVGGVVEGLHPPHPVVVDAGQVRADGAGAGGEEHLVEAEHQGAGPVVVAHLDLPGIQVDADRLVAGAHVDELALPELLRRPGDQVVDLIDLTSHQVGDAAGGVARVPPRSRATMSRWRWRRRAWEAADMPAASPPITTSRSATG